MPTFIGLDLAWTAHRENVPYESGICVLEGEHSNDVRCTHIESTRLHVTALAEKIASTANRSVPVIVAIDAPLIVTERRTAESKLNRVFGPYKAGAYKASLDWLERKDLKAGPQLGRALKTHGFTLDPAALLGESPEDYVSFEVYPHAVHVRLFNLAERIRYKKGRKAERHHGLLSYQNHLRQLCKERAPGVLRNDSVRAALAPETLEGLPGSSKKGIPTLKHYEDMLDGLTCALAAWMAWRDPGAWETIGDLNGYIVTPREPSA